MRMIKGIIFCAVVAMPLMGLGEEVTNVTWKSSISLGATYKDGNTDKQLYTMDFKGSRYAPKSDWVNSLHGEYGLTQSGTNATVQTEGQLRGQSDYRYKFGTENFYGGVFCEGYHDAIKDINVRVKVGPNVGYYFINKKTMKLDASFGINEVYERTSDNEDSYAEWRVAGNYLWTISETASCYANAEYSAAVDEYENGTGLLVVGAKSKMTEKLSLFVELRDEYDNMPAADTQRLDTTITAGLTYDLL